MKANNSHSNQSPKNETLEWLQQSVEEFFKNCNWAGQPLALQEMQPGDPLPFTVTVEEFFLGLPWEGKPVVAAPPKPAMEASVKTAETVPQSTLADLMEIF